MSHRRRAFAPPLILLLLAAAARAETFPPTPTHRVTDESHILTPAAAQSLEAELAKFEHDTTNQVIVAIYPHMDSAATLDDYATRLFNAWGVGQAGKNNGVALLIFSDDRKLRITVGSGLETALPDTLCQKIVDTDLLPNFKAAKYDDGVTAATHSILKALRTPATAPATAPARASAIPLEPTGRPPASPSVLGAPAEALSPTHSNPSPGPPISGYHPISTSPFSGIPCGFATVFVIVLLLNIFRRAAGIPPAPRRRGWGSWTNNTSDSWFSSNSSSDSSSSSSDSSSSSSSSDSGSSSSGGGHSDGGGASGSW